MKRLLDIMAALRDPETGCPWDIKQTYDSIVPYTIEETYEVADAIERKDYQELKKELGDLLFQVVFYCQLAKEEGRFDFDDVVNGVSDKLTDRHPHVFGDETFDDDEALHKAWEDKKHAERKEKNHAASLMDDIPKSLPALKQAQKMQKRAAKQGFDWPDIKGAWDKFEEEVGELKAEEPEQNKERIEDELGDVFFTMVNLARFYQLDAETCLRKASQKFERRFRTMEHLIHQDSKQLSDMSLKRLDAYWEKAKQELSA